MDLRSAWTKWGMITGLFVAAGLLLSVEVYFTLHVYEPKLPFAEVMAAQFQRVVLWALLLPLVLALRVRVPFRRGRRVRAAAFHLAVSLLIMAAYYAARVLVGMHYDHVLLRDFGITLRAEYSGHNLVDVFYYWLVLAGAYTIELQQKYRSGELKSAQLETRLFEAELRALKQQLHPHFLFNTLNTVSVLVREGKNPEAVGLLAQLSALLRRTLDSAQPQEVALRDELEFLRLYLEIQRARFADRLQVRTAVSPRALEARIPNLLLQPAVENAVLHGIARKSGPGLVEIIGEERDGRLCLEIRDDGPGLPPPDARPARAGIGLSATRERLAKLYGNGQRMEVRSNPGGGVSVLISLPFRV